MTKENMLDKNGLINRYVKIIAFDLIRSKRVDLENSVVDRYEFNVHNIMFTVVIGFSLIFILDVLFGESFLSKAFINVLGANVNLEEISNRQYFRIFFAEASFLSVVIGLVSGIYFYVKYGGDFYRAMLYSKPDMSFIFNYVGNLIGAFIGVCIGIYGGFLVAIKFVEVLSIDALPFVFVLQIVVVAKTLSIAAPSVCRIIQLLVPYSIHPKRKK